MYTAGIRKIFDATHLGKSLEKTKEIVNATGYKAFSFNGIVLVKVKRGEKYEWEKTCFAVQDFTDSGE